ncbi:GumC family protein [Dongia sp. agr-C8]
MSALPSVRELLAAVFRNVRWIALALIAPPVVAVILAFTLPKVYQADAKLLIKPGREFMPAASMGQNEFALPSSSMAEIVKSEVEILNSKDLAESTLKKVSVGSLYPDLAAAPEDVALERAVMRFESQLRVDPIDLSTVVNVGFRSKDPEIATRVLTALLTDFQARHVNVYSTGQIQPIQEQIAAKQKDLEALDAKRIAYQNQTGAFSIPEQRASLITQRAAVQTLLHDAEIKESALEQQVAFLKKSKANTPKMAALESETDPSSQTSSEALQQLMALRQKEQEMLERYQPTAPAMVQIRAQIAQAEQFVKQAQSPSSTKTRTGANPLLASIDQQLLTAQSELTPITSQIEGYKSQIANFDDQLKQLQASELEVNNLERQIQSLTADLQTLRTNLEQARLAENMDQAKVSSVSIIDAPRLEPRPVFPKKTFFGLAGVAIGLVIAGLIALMSLSFGNTIITVEGAERIFSVPVVAALPDLKPLPAK